MQALSIQRVVVVVVGIVVLILGITAGIGVIMAVILSGGSFPYPNTLAGVSQGLALILSSALLAGFSIIGGLTFLMPVRMGRLWRVAGYITPDAEVVPKAYRAGGAAMLGAGILAAVVNFLFAPMDMLDVAILLVVIIAGIIGLLAGLSRAR